MTERNIPAGWYADPQGAPRRLRWWDGSRWTEHTHPEHQAQAPAPPSAPVPAQGRPVPHQYAPEPYAPDEPGAAPAGPGGGTLFSEPVLVVSQRAGLIEVANEAGMIVLTGMF